MPPDDELNGSPSNADNSGSSDAERGAQLLRDLSGDSGADDPANQSDPDGENDARDPEGGDSEGSDPDGSGSPDGDDDDFLARFGEEALNATRQAAREEAARELEQQREAQAREEEQRRRRSQQREQLTNAYRTRLGNLKAFAAQHKLDEQTATQLENTFLNHHRDAVQVAAHELTEDLVSALRDALPEDVREGFDYDGSGELEPLVREFRDRLSKSATSGLYTQAQLEERVALRALEVARQIKERLKTDPGFLDSFAAPPRRTGGNPTPAKKSYAQLEMGYGEGTLSAAEEQEYLRLRSEREMSGRA